MSICVLLILTVFLLLSPSFCSLGNKGACQINGNHGIKIQQEQIEGRWYVQAVSSSYFLQNPSDKCHFISLSFDTEQGEPTNNIKPFHFENIVFQHDKQKKTHSATGTFSQPGLLNLNFKDFSEEFLSFEFVYFEDDFSVSVLVGCNNGKYIGSSDVFVLSRDSQQTFDEIEKAIDEAEKLGFDTSDLATKNTRACIRLY